ncbi:Mor family transcriptional regulator [Duganella sp. SG902]|uniref:Mor transcription activator family protein n=1 Tax=Duganella sp. SG902 TaxID=2587016 RepID=UPI00159E6EE8|nr:Mor transcription activator family protein [Duganella sp. SG902]NVM78882.1 Mor family transcriptional regulator [Duganella sp. SG902]
MTSVLHPDQIALTDLPHQVRHIAAIVGLSAALKLVQNYGGVRLYVPVTMRPDHILARMIGFDEACKLSAEFGGMDHFDIPRAAGAIRLVRNREIVYKFVKGKTLRQLALEYVLTERAIQKILSEAGASIDDRQVSLF